MDWFTSPAVCPKEAERQPAPADSLRLPAHRPVPGAANTYADPAEPSSHAAAHFDLAGAGRQSFRLRPQQNKAGVAMK